VRSRDVLEKGEKGKSEKSKRILEREDGGMSKGGKGGKGRVGENARCVCKTHRACAVQAHKQELLCAVGPRK
jgi:hypothetical protein